jgi:hypothetical protein
MMKRVPIHERIQEQWKDEDGYWIALKSGWGVLGDPGFHTIHEDTKKEAMSIAADSIPCDCRDCLADKSLRADAESQDAADMSEIPTPKQAKK